MLMETGAVTWCQRYFKPSVSVEERRRGCVGPRPPLVGGFLGRHVLVGVHDEIGDFGSVLGGCLVLGLHT